MSYSARQLIFIAVITAVVACLLTVVVLSAVAPLR
jgi:hypothetical protein